MCQYFHFSFIGNQLLSCLLLVHLIPFIALSFDNSFWYIGKKFFIVMQHTVCLIGNQIAFSCLLLVHLIPFTAVSFYNSLWYIGKSFLLSYNLIGNQLLSYLLLSSGWCNLNCIYSYFNWSDFFHGLNFWDQWHLCLCLGVRFFHDKKQSLFIFQW